MEPWDGALAGALLIPSLVESLALLWVLLTMFMILLLAGTVAAYVAFPRRGADVPALPWVGIALERGVEALPTLHNERPHAFQ